MENIVIHIGLRKTASTFLQHNVFPKIPGVLYQNEGTSLFSYDKISGKEVLLISNEDIPGWPYLKQVKHNSFFDQFKDSLLTIKRIFREPRIIVCFREPSRFIYSNYKQFLHEGGVVEWEDFFSLHDNGSLLDKEDYYFSKYVDYLFEHFNAENLFLYNFDDFKKDNDKLIKSICHFINPEIKNLDLTYNSSKKANPSVKYKFENTLIKLNRWDKWVKDKWGFHLRIRLFGKILNPRVFCQYILPKIIETKAERNLTEVKKYYEEDWERTKLKLYENRKIL